MLDIKSKSNKKFSFAAAGIAVMLAVVAFMACYPVFERRASHYYTAPARSTQLLEYFYKGNLVFYKSMLDKTGNGQLSYADLYLLTEEENLSDQAWDYDIDSSGVTLMEGQTLAEYKDTLKRAVNSAMEGWEEDVLESISRNMDYCVVDHKTGEIIKNTGRGIERLYKDKSLQDENAPYVYYVMMTYDDKGNLADLSVRDEKSDELLKSAQNVLAGKLLGNHLVEFGYTYGLEDYDTVYFGNDGKKLTWHIDDRPKGMTFIYACTRQQKEVIDSIWRNGSFQNQYRYEIENAYYRAGTSGVYWIILAILALAALLLTRAGGYCLHRMAGVRIHLEIAIPAIFCMIWGVEVWVTQLVYYSNNGVLEGVLEEYLAFLRETFPVLMGCINVLALALIFGAWFYLVTTFGEVFDLGPRAFVRERSFLVKIILWMVSAVREKAGQLKDEVLHVDLGGEAEHTVRKLVLINFFLMAGLCFLWMFGWIALVVYTVILYIGLKKYVQKIQEQYRKLLGATRSIAEGNLQTEFEEDWGVFESYKAELSKIQNGFRAAVDEEVKSQKMKTELITNVSHDLKTPLTAITTYIELLGEENVTEEQRKEYLEVLTRKSQRLKCLIEDLFEVSKATSGNVTLNPVEVDICHLMRQVYLEYEDKIEDAGLLFRFQVPEDKVILQLDSQKTYRIFENLYVNIIKYAMPHTRVYVDAWKTEKGIHIEMKNMSAAELNIPAQDLTERFVRGDSSRNTEGSGLGLAIARSFAELQGGMMKLEIDGDLFKVVIEF